MKTFTTNEDYLRDFFEHAPVGFHAFGPDQVFVDINASELEMLGYQRDEIIHQKTWSDLIVEADRAKFQQHWRDILKKGQVRNLEYTMLHKSGRPIKVLLNATARFDQDGQLINTRGSVVDITERKRLSDKLLADKKRMQNNVKALRKMLKTMREEKQELKESMQLSLRQRILPLIQKIKSRGTPRHLEVIQSLEQNVAEITNGVGDKVYSEEWNLSARETEICFLVQSGLKTREIAELLFSSTRTIDNHRNHIRKKLQITDKNLDLADYLKNL